MYVQRMSIMCHTVIWFFYSGKNIYMAFNFNIVRDTIGKHCLQYSRHHATIDLKSNIVE